MKKRYDKPELLTIEVFIESSIVTASLNTGEGSGPVIEDENEQEDNQEWVIE